jgi:hypothetical protein
MARGLSGSHDKLPPFFLSLIAFISLGNLAQQAAFEIHPRYTS